MYNMDLSHNCSITYWEGEEIFQYEMDQNK